MNQMRFGLCPPQGYFNEFDGWDPVKAWKRILEVWELGGAPGFRVDLDRRARHLQVGRPGSNAFDFWTMTTAIATRIPSWRSASASSTPRSATRRSRRRWRPRST